MPGGDGGAASLARGRGGARAAVLRGPRARVSPLGAGPVGGRGGGREEHCSGGGGGGRGPSAKPASGKAHVSRPLLRLGGATPGRGLREAQSATPLR